jgi:competence protein ComFB
MHIHNVMEDIVIGKVQNICESIEATGSAQSTQGICTCDQCRLDAASYVLNRITPCYVVSSRGAARIGQETLDALQQNVDIDVMIYKALQQVSHNQRPYHDEKQGTSVHAGAVFNIPTIVGHIYNGVNFEPMFDIEVQLLREGNLVPMKDFNWQNPCNLVQKTGGAFTFWPAPLPAESSGEKKGLEFLIRAQAPGFDTLEYVFEMALTSEAQQAQSFSMDRTHRLLALYMFPPEQDSLAIEA